MLLNILIVLATVALMEGVAYATHRFVMHGPLGWGWHKSHHEETEGALEKNDLYAVVFSILSGALITFGIAGVWPLRQIGIGLMVYGILYFIVHDGLVHHRWPFRWVPRTGYLKRLVQAHKMHHAVEGRDGCVSFGFLYAPPLANLKARLKANASVRSRRDRATAPDPADRSPALK
ncbi:sterol desaturase family protein [Acuticoccus sp. MNP-M23]|uniref:sterol desaturase family protein n=1 Tax=Acuticoccus sp. MNP-M23 TaxID=3072793 RepID=UPI0028164D0C|nr:sterol desaturase family protein [Acuticoccus sp. MNP-M23]WMS43367.1 sterol desaturase family protein [Acuticoccus sp. MNP-M23]